jgi:hypothetical protein
VAPWGELAEDRQRTSLWTPWAARQVIAVPASVRAAPRSQPQGLPRLTRELILGWADAFRRLPAVGRSSHPDPFLNPPRGTPGRIGLSRKRNRLCNRARRERANSPSCSALAARLPADNAASRQGSSAYHTKKLMAALVTAIRRRRVSTAGWRRQSSSSAIGCRPALLLTPLLALRIRNPKQGPGAALE